MDFTGERMVPGQAPLMLEMAHRARYQFAEELCRGKRVLDFGCGAGYGSQMLSRAAAKVLGLDISREAVEYAQKHYQASNLDYMTGDIDLLVSSQRRYDTVVCFEVIEHLENPKMFLKDLTVGMTGSGHLIISTPNGQDEQNPYHHHGWDADEFKDLLSSDFTGVTIYGQGSSRDVNNYRQQQQQALQQAIHQAERIKGRNPLAKSIPRRIRHSIYAWLVGRSLPNEKQWTADDFPISENNKEGEIIIAVCKKK